MNVLIVEPSRFSRLAVTLALEHDGLFVDAVDSRQEAIECLNKQDYQAICLARTLGLGAVQSLCSHIKSRSNTELIPIVMLTAGEEFDTEPHMALGIAEIFDKTEIKSLGQHLEKICGKNTDTKACGGKILYIEDSVSTAATVMSQLKRDHHEVTLCTSGEQAIEIYEHDRYDLVLTDVVLSGKINGIEVIRHIRENETDEMVPVPILAMSAFTDTSRTLLLLQSGANDYVSKPILEEELQARVSNLILTQHQFKKLQVQQKRLEQLAMTDQLTGLYNRHYLEHVAHKKIAFARRHNVDLCLIVIDVDHFKQVNDQHGHATGDTVLTHISQLLSSSMRDEDIVARYGGEEFVIVMEHCSLDFAIEKAEQLRQGIEQLRPEDLNVSASFGVTHYRKEIHDDFNSLFSRADAAVYRAKENGRNCVVTG